MKKALILIGTIWLSIILFVPGCEESKLGNLERRLDAFRDILPEKLKEKFDSGDYQDVVTGLDLLLSSDSTFRKDYKILKDKEAINVFSTQEVVDFYREYFVEEIKRLKKKKE